MRALTAVCAKRISSTRTRTHTQHTHHNYTRPQAKDRRRAGIYEAPCYRVKARRGNNFITTFSLRTEDDKAKWIMRGVALLCSVD